MKIKITYKNSDACACVIVTNASASVHVHSDLCIAMPLAVSTTTLTILTNASNNACEHCDEGRKKIGDGDAVCRYRGLWLCAVHAKHVIEEDASRHGACARCDKNKPLIPFHIGSNADGPVYEEVCADCAVRLMTGEASTSGALI